MQALDLRVRPPSVRNVSLRNGDELRNKSHAAFSPASRVTHQSIKSIHTNTLPSSSKRTQLAKFTHHCLPNFSIEADRDYQTHQDTTDSGDDGVKISIFTNHPTAKITPFPATSATNNDAVAAAAAAASTIAPKKRRIDHDQMEHVAMRATHANIVIVLDDGRIAADRQTLAERSSYFSALLYNGMRETFQTEIKLWDVQLQPFRLLLRHMYAGRMDVCFWNVDDVCQMLLLADYFGYDRIDNIGREIGEYVMGSAIIHDQKWRAYVERLCHTAKTIELTHLHNVCTVFLQCKSQ